jgi:hypothetical protein
MTTLILSVALTCAATGFLVARLWSNRTIRRERERLAGEVVARVHDARQPIQAIELYIAALERRLQSEEERQLASQIRLAIAQAHTQLKTLEQGVAQT